MTDRSPRAVVESHLAQVSEGMTGALADNYALDAVVDLPFMPGGGVRLAGRQALRAHFERAASVPLTLRVSNLVVHETSNPSVLVAEYDYDGCVTPTSHAFAVANVQIFGVTDGKIARSRDYHDHAAIGAALSAQGGGATQA